MDSDKEIIASFAQKETYILDVFIEGQGTVVRSPDKDEYCQGERVSLTAQADNGWSFQEWRGQASGASPQIRLTMDANKEIRAVFVKENKGLQLSLDVVGSGIVSKNPDLIEYEEGVEVLLEATASNGWQYQDWSGDLSSTSTSIQILMDDHKYIKATFIEKQSGFVLNTSIGQGQGAIIREPDLPFYPAGTLVLVKAVVEYEEWLFDYWLIDGKKTYINEQKLVMDKDRTAEVYFYCPI